MDWITYFGPWARFCFRCVWLRKTCGLALRKGYVRGLDSVDHVVFGGNACIEECGVWALV